MIGPVIASPAFKNADFRRLWASAACNYLGMSGEQVILGWLVFRITQSTKDQEGGRGSPGEAEAARGRLATDPGPV